MFKQLTKIKEYLVLATVFLFPLTFAGTFIDQASLPKLIILGVLVSLAFIVIAVEIYLTGKVNIARSKLDLPVIVLVVGYLLSAIFVTPNKMEAFFIPGTASFIALFGLTYFLVNTIDRAKVKIALVASAVALALMVFGSFLGVFEKISQLPAFMKGSAFNPAGDYMTGTIFLAAIVPFAVYFVIKEVNMIKKLVFALALAFILMAGGISIFTLATTSKKATPVLPSFQTSWAVGIDTIRESPVFGIGPGNYLTAFNRFRPVAYNLSEEWQLRFSTGRNWYLTILTEAGLLGLTGIALLLFTIIKNTNKSIAIYKQSRSLLIDPLSLSVLGVLIIVFAILPISSTSLFLVFILLALNSQAKLQNVSFSFGENHSSDLKAVVSLVIIGLVIFLGFKARPVLLAETRFKAANDSLIANDGKKTYDYLAEAINLNPFVDRYHASYAQVNLAIARSIAGSVEKPEDLTDDQKNTILQLIQQAIREGQNTVRLNPTRAANWQVLSNIYQVVIPYANEADKFAVESYNKTVGLDPIDPNLRIALGGLYYSLGQYDNAISSFQFAILVKPDLANAYYNIATAYTAKNDFTNAIAAMKTVLTLVEKDSEDYKLAQKDLETLENKQKDLQASEGSSNLTTPQKSSAPAINPQLTLPEEASPPEGPSVPSPTPTASATGIPTPSATPTPLP